jgi:predicted Zn-dependent protease
MSEWSPTVRNPIFTAMMFMEMGQPQRALDVLQHPPTEHLEDSTFWLVRAQAYYDLGEWSQARKTAHQGLALAPQNPHLLLLLANLEAKAGDLPAAEQAILSALNQQPEHPTLLCRYALLVAEDGQLDKAERLLARAAQQSPEDPSVRRTTAALAYLRGDDKQAMQANLETLRDNPEDVVSRHALGAMLLEKGYVKAADRHLKAAARLDPGEQDVVAAARISQPYAHWLLWPLRPAYRLGSAKTWLLWVGTYVLLTVLGLHQIARPLAILWILYCVYSWVVPPLIKWWYKRRYGALQ